MKYNAMHQKKIFISKLRKIRMIREETQEAFAEELNIPVSTYKKIETGKSNPSLEFLCQLRHVTGLPIDFFIEKEDTDSNMVLLMIENMSELEKLETLGKLVESLGVNPLNEMINKVKGEQDNEKRINIRGPRNNS